MTRFEPFIGSPERDVFDPLDAVEDIEWFGQAPHSTVDSMRRVQSASAVPFMHMPNKSHVNDSNDSMALPIRPTRRTLPEDIISSHESSQSFLNSGLANSYTEESFGMHFLQGGPQDRFTSVTEYGFRGSASTASQAALHIPAPGGHWAWIPSNEQQNNNLDSSIAMRDAPQPMIPVNIGGLPLPVPTNTYSGAPVPAVTDLTPPLPTTADGLEIDFLDSFDIMEMAKTLDPVDFPVMPSRQRVVGSCPLPMLLEDSLSAEDDRSEGTGRFPTSVNYILPSSPSERGRSASDTTSASRDSGSGQVGGGGSGMSMARAGHSGIPIPLGTRSIPLKVRSSSSHPHLPSLLASSLPPERPMRTAARRSLAVTAAALRETMGDSDSDASEGGIPFSSSYPSRRTHSHFGHSVGRHNTSNASNASGKKKHNPWSLQETLALVEGVKSAGIGKWAEIKRLPIPNVAGVLEGRTPVDLKDKWRNLTRVARLPKAALRQRLQRSPSDVPLETMLLVKHLMENGQNTEY